ncbi:hypothetical protein CYMTET_43315 [Cymbomonas tetramitiformis]|uniref:Uncharacterized protein n=1 Tax=Cymbomonas tetramitiformis TaxID=36881 RepID=A0AAE0F0R8_9CHLO|nr:hypothetical protein CYMTET_43315 [Cymbomonas tetramitiformis]
MFATQQVMYEENTKVQSNSTGMFVQSNKEWQECQKQMQSQFNDQLKELQTSHQVESAVMRDLLKTTISVAVAGMSHQQSSLVQLGAAAQMGPPALGPPGAFMSPPGQKTAFSPALGNPMFATPPRPGSQWAGGHIELTAEMRDTAEKRGSELWHELLRSATTKYATVKVVLQLRELAARPEVALDVFQARVTIAAFDLYMKASS